MNYDEKFASEFQSSIQDLADVEILRHSRLLIFGGGGIGSCASIFLVRLGIENITCWDFDHVEIRNIPRSVYDNISIGMKKSSVIARQARCINPNVNICTVHGDILQAPQTMIRNLAQSHHAALIAADNFEVHAKLNQIFQSQIESVYTYVTNNGDSAEIIRTAPGEPGCVRCLTNFTARRRAGITRNFSALGIDFFRVSIEAVSVILGILLRGRKGGDLFRDYVDPSAHLFFILSRRRGELAQAMPAGFLGGIISAEIRETGTQCPVCGNR